MIFHSPLVRIWLTTKIVEKIVKLNGSFLKGFQVFDVANIEIVEAFFLMGEWFLKYEIGGVLK